MKRKDASEIIIHTGDDRDCPIGDFINALDELVCWFEANRDDFDVEACFKIYVAYMAAE